MELLHDNFNHSSSKLSVLVVGGSVGGLSCAHGLLRADCSVIVFEKARTLAPLGAGLALDEVECCPALREWGFGDALLQHAIPLAVEENRAVERKAKSLHPLAVNPLHNSKALHWSDLHKFLYDALPKDIVRWGHEVVAFEEIKDGKKVKVLVRQLETGGTIENEGDLLVAADGCNSRIRANFLPEERRRYSGYSAWRGVVDRSAEGSKEVLMAMKKRYPNLGNTVYVEMTGESHSAVFEIPGGRLNWLWYVNQPEPTFKGSSLTARSGEEAIAKALAEAEEELTPEMAALMRATPSPFLQAICDREPLKKMVWGRVVLLGEAAHPTTPHAARSTNMSILDAVTLSKCLSAIAKTRGGASSAIAKACEASSAIAKDNSGAPTVTTTTTTTTTGDEALSSKTTTPRAPSSSSAIAKDCGASSAIANVDPTFTTTTTTTTTTTGDEALSSKTTTAASSSSTADFCSDEGLFAALARYEGLRLPATTQQLLFSRFLGQLKQGHLHGKEFSWLQASPEECIRLVQAQWDAFDVALCTTKGLITIN